MKYITSFILFFSLILFISNLNAEVKNEDKPLKGEWDFQLQPVWDVESAGEDVLVSVRAIRVDDNGNIYLFEGKHNKFFVFDSNGELSNSFGKRGEGPGEYKDVFNFFLINDSIIAPDQGRIHYFSKKGKFLKTVNPGFISFPRTFIDENRFIMIHENEDEKQKYEKLEIYDLERKKRSLLAEVVAEKLLSASSESGGRQMAVKIKISNTTPVVVLALHNNSLYFGKNDLYSIKKVDLKRNELLSFSLKGRERKKIPMDYKKKLVERISLNNRKMPPAMVDQIVKGMPEYAPYFNQISIEEKGLIYVYINDPANERGQEIDIFSPEGKYLYHAHIVLPDGLIKTRGIVIKGEFMYVFAEDNDGERKLVKYKIVKP